MARRSIRVPASRPPYAGDVSIVPQRPGGMRGGMRRPQHTWHNWLRAWELTPSFIAPVLPGDTLRAAMLQARTVQASGVMNSLTVGWWHEMFIWYVRLGDLEVADVMRNAIIDPSANMDSIAFSGTAQQQNGYMHRVTTRPSWVYECLRTVTRAYFRDEGEAWNAHMGTDGVYPLVQITGSSWLDSAFPASALPAAGTGDEWSQQWNVHQGMRGAKLTTATFEEYLAMSGVSAPPLLRETTQDFRIPELIRFVRDYAYPQTQLNPSNGTVQGSVNWAVAERIDKKRFFDQPGFLFGAQVIRPKVYLGGQMTSAGDVLLNTANGWQPPQFDSEPHTHLRKFPGVVSPAVGTGPVHGATVDYWLDGRDLFLRGDQFLNDMDAADPISQYTVALPNESLAQRKYVTVADREAMFENLRFEVDGVVSLQIASRIAADRSTAHPSATGA